MLLKILFYYILLWDGTKEESDYCINAIAKPKPEDEFKYTKPQNIYSKIKEKEIKLKVPKILIHCKEERGVTLMIGGARA